MSASCVGAAPLSTGVTRPRLSAEQAMEHHNCFETGARWFSILGLVAGAACSSGTSGGSGSLGSGGGSTSSTGGATTAGGTTSASGGSTVVGSGGATSGAGGALGTGGTATGGSVA